MDRRIRNFFRSDAGVLFLPASRATIPTFCSAETCACLGRRIGRATGGLDEGSPSTFFSVTTTRSLLRGTIMATAQAERGTLAGRGRAARVESTGHSRRLPACREDEVAQRRLSDVSSPPAARARSGTGETRVRGSWLPQDTPRPVVCRRVRLGTP